MDREESERLEREFRRSFPDTHHSIDDLFAEDDRVAMRTTDRATHRGEFQGIAPTDRPVEFTALVIDRIEDNTIAASWGAIDFPRLMRQLRSATPNRWFQDKHAVAGDASSRTLSILSAQRISFSREYIETGCHGRNERRLVRHHVPEHPVSPAKAAPIR